MKLKRQRHIICHFNPWNVLISNMYFFKSQRYLHGIHQLSSTADSAHIGWNQAKSAVLLSRWIPWRHLYDFENYIFEIRTFRGLKWRILCLCIFSFSFLVFIIWGGESTCLTTDFHDCHHANSTVSSKLFSTLARILRCLKLKIYKSKVTC